MLFKFSIFLLFFGKCMCCVLSCLGMSNSVTPRTGAHQAGSSVHGDSPGNSIGVGCHALLQGIFLTQGSNPGLPHRRRTLRSEPPGKPKNTGVGSLSLLQGIFPTQESNLGLLHCRRILYQLSYQGSPSISCTPKHVGMS